jgi:hypothetical protein
MGILLDILKTIFCKLKKQETIERGDNIDKIKKQEIEDYNPIMQSETEVGNEQEPETVFEEPKKEDVKKTYNTRVRGFKNFTKEKEVLKYLLTYGSIDKFTCKEKFGLKRLDNIICELRKQGMLIVNETIYLHNEKGEKVKVNNYRLVTENGAN